MSRQTQPMRVSDWIDESASSILDIGCNVGAWIGDCARRYPAARLAGVDLNKSAVEVASARVPTADFRHAGAESLPFASESFDYVTCCEVLEHIAPDSRSSAFREIHRVLRPGGQLVLTVPHAGLFAWLDSNNIRFRFPRIYRWVIGEGLRDHVYASAKRQVEPHYHFTLPELLELAGKGWEKVAVQHGGLIVTPLVDWASWPFYRLGVHDHPIRRLLERLAAWDRRIDYGSASYGVLLVLRKPAEKTDGASNG